MADRQLADLQERKEKLVDAFVYRQAIDQATHSRELDKLNEEITLAEMAAKDASSTPSTWKRCSTSRSM